MIRVRAGDPVYINIPMTGAPLPDVRWTVNKQHLQDTPRTRQEVLEDLIKLTFPKTERGDSGVYNISAKNAYGEDSADITLLVYGMYRLLCLFTEFLKKYNSILIYASKCWQAPNKGPSPIWPKWK